MRRRWVAGLAAAGLAAVALVVVSSGDDRSDPPTDSGGTPVTVPERASRPVFTVPVTDPGSDPSSDDVTDGALAADGPPGTARLPSPSERLVLGSAPREFVIDVADELQAINPTEVVALAAGGGLYEISLPSGRVRVTDLGFEADGTNVVANDGGALIWPTPEGGVQIVSVDQSLGFFDQPLASVTWSPGTTTMYLWPAGNNGADDTEIEQVTGLDLDGAAFRSVDAGFLDATADPPPFLDGTGAVLRRDSGGTYRIDATGTELLTTGDVISTGANHVLLRECDSTRACTLVSIDNDGLRRVWDSDLVDSFTPQAVGGLSPGGDALIVHADRVAPDAAREIFVLELTDGALAPLRTPPAAEADAIWDTNGAGFFFSDLFLLLYVDRFDGAPIIVSDALPQMRAVAARRPIATPICEVIAIVQPVFAEMTGDAEISAPLPEALDRMLELAPEALATEIDDLVSFVNSFVSPEAAGSEVSANWPANVRSGLDALDSYAAAECPLVETERSDGAIRTESLRWRDAAEPGQT